MTIWPLLARNVLLLPLDLDQASYYNNTSTWELPDTASYRENLLPGMFVTAGIRYDYEKASLSTGIVCYFTGQASSPVIMIGTKNILKAAWLPKFSILQKWNDSYPPT